MSDKVKKNILIVEDEMGLIAAIKDAMMRKNFKVWQASSVTAAKALIVSVKKMDAVWLDHYLLGQESGLDFVAWLKKQAKWREVPIFLITNTASPEKIHNYLSLGIAKYYTKSNVKLDQIISDILAFLNQNNNK